MKKLAIKLQIAADWKYIV